MEPRVLLSLEQHDVMDFVVKEVPRLEEEDHQASWKRHGLKARKIFMDSMKSHLIFHISKVAIAK